MSTYTRLLNKLKTNNFHKKKKIEIKLNLFIFNRKQIHCECTYELRIKTVF